MALAGTTQEDVDYFILHQSNQFIMKHLAKKLGIPEEKMPLTLGDFGNTGGPSVPLTVTRAGLVRPPDRPLDPDARRLRRRAVVGLPPWSGWPRMPRSATWSSRTGVEFGRTSGIY
ncbi:MAG: hypothetical protein M0C28_27505 [Candidatus Moduliflexus flocculans]|nr:hypothetical protein [Candidatus Moduliflexus flocculans]